MGKNSTKDVNSQLFERQKPTIAPGLYKAGSEYKKLIASWDDLLVAKAVTEDGHAYFGRGICPTCNAADILAGALVIPEGITELADYAYSACDRLTEIIFPTSLTRIGKSAFDYCDALTEVIIPDNVTSIGESAFEECINLETVTIGPKVSEFGNFAFANCIRVKSVTIKEGATSIGPWLFYNCKNLTELNIPSTVTTISEGAFGCCRLLSSINIPAATTKINPRAFVTCEGIKSIAVDANNKVYHSECNCLIETSSKTLVLACANSIIPENGSVTEIGSYAFCTESEVASIKLPNSIVSIGEGAFSYSKLVSVFIPSSVRSIGSYAFSDCCNLVTITCPKGSNLTVIGEAAFNGCLSLVKIDLPDSVVSLGRSAFGDCATLSFVSIGTEKSKLATVGSSAFFNCQKLSILKFAGHSDEWHAVALDQDWRKESMVNFIVCADSTISFI